MAIELVDNVTGDGLFDILAKFAKLLETLNTVRGSTVASDALDAVNQYKTKTDTTLDFDRVMEFFASSEENWRIGGDSFADAIAEACQGLLGEFVKADDPSAGDDLAEQIEYVIDQMVTQGYRVNGNSVSIVAAADGGNATNDLAFLFGTKGTDSKTVQNMLAESIVAEVISVTGEIPTLRLTGERAARSPLSEDYPLGSGISLTISALLASESENLIVNGDFEDGDETTSHSPPPSWLMIDGSAEAKAVESQSFTISGTPTAGYWWIKYTNPLTATEHFTAQLDFDATASDVESALQSIPGLENVTVTSTGTAPNLTHVVRLFGVTSPSPGAAYFVASHTFDTGTVGASLGDGGEKAAIHGRPMLMFANDVHQILQPVELVPDTVYVVAVRLAIDNSGGEVGGSAQFRISIVDGDQNILTDHQGNSLTTTKAFTAIEPEIANPATIAGFLFSLPAINADTRRVYVQLEIDSLHATLDLFIDDCIVAPATELYAGGPYVAILAGARPPDVADKWTLTASNDNYSLWQQRFNQLFDMAEKRLVLPHTGATEIPESLFDEPYESSSSTSSSSSSST